MLARSNVVNAINIKYQELFCAFKVFSNISVLKYLIVFNQKCSNIDF